jgi:hypothetical protein
MACLPREEDGNSRDEYGSRLDYWSGGGIYG